MFSTLELRILKKPYVHAAGRFLLSLRDIPLLGNFKLTEIIVPKVFHYSFQSVTSSTVPRRFSIITHSAADFQKTGKNSYFFALAYFNKPNSGLYICYIYVYINSDTPW